MGWGAFVLVGALSLPALPAAGQATITVNTTADNTTAGNTFCTLREALTNANNNSDATSGDCAAGVGATDTIAFTIGAGGSLATIQPTSALPTITEGVTIDGTTQCGGSVPCIELDGSSAGAGVDGLTITGPGSTITGLVINRFGGDGVDVSGMGATGNTIAGNYIGTDETGTLDLGNTQNGVLIFDGAANNIIGGTATGAGNVISGNNIHGVLIFANGATGNTLVGNYIGTDVTGTADLGNSGNGVLLFDGAANNTIGGTAADAANTVAFNGQNGVALASDAGTGNAIQRNSLFSNGELGIDLGDDGVTPNDPGDGDGSPNNLQNFPAFTHVGIDGSGELILRYWVDSDPANATYPMTVAFFKADADEEEGQVFFASDSYSTTDHGGCGAPPCTKRINLGGATGLGVSQGDFLVATATDQDGNTSEFSAPAVEVLQTAITVNTTADNTTASDGNCTLREAITNAESNSDTTGGDCAAGTGPTDSIVFRITPRGSLATIQPTSALPAITEGVTIDGTTQGCTGSMSCIKLGGGSAGVGASGLTITGSYSTIRGLVINRFDHDGILVSGTGATDNTIAGNYIGTDETGTLDFGNDLGVLIRDGASSNTIGGTTPEARNVISGNLYGVMIVGNGATSNTILGNFIGTDVTGTADLGGNFGVRIEDGASSNTVGGTTAEARNIISGNNIGVRIESAGTMGNLVQGNFIGTDVTGTADLGNGDGVRIEGGASSNTIGGTDPGAGNLISGNIFDGVEIRDSGTTGNLVQGNFIGTNSSSTADLGNSLDGIKITNGASDNTVGGTSPEARNVISGNFNGVGFQGSGTTGNLVQGNFIGTNVNGTAALGNTVDGVLIEDGASSNTIGGTSPEARNVISGNTQNGVRIDGSGSTDNLVQGNYIGTNVNGTAALGNTVDGVLIEGGAANNTIGGTTAEARNVISGNFNGVGFQGSGTTGNLVQGNFIGTDVTGTAALGNSVQGVVIEGSAANNTIGGTATGARNVISGNNGDGVEIRDSGTTGNLVQGNFIGTNVNGTTALGNTVDGVRISFGASSNTIGGTSPEARNVISGNHSGVSITYSGTTGNLVQGNFIGTDVNGTADLGNSSYGVFIIDGPSSNTIGGTTPEARNVISGNFNGVGFQGSGTTGNLVQGNFIGTDSTGTAALGNSSYGVSIHNGASSNTIGGTAPGARNVISGNGGGVGITHGGTTGNFVQGNFIGTDSTGTAALGNTADGVSIHNGASSNTIGGTTPGSSNVISGNGVGGVRIQGSGTTSNTIAGNFIGTDSTGTADLGNGFFGVVIQISAANNTIGGQGPGGGPDPAANTIAFNSLEGIVLTSTAGTGNAIRRNSLFSNGQLGIDLSGDGATPNDPNDPDTGPNRLQNFPDLTSAAIDGSGDLILTYSVDTRTHHATYPLSAAFFEADADHEEGQRFLGSDLYNMGDYSGCGPPPCEKTVNLGGAAALGVSPGERLVATTTDLDGNTSEFSPPTALPVLTVRRYVATTGDDTGNDCTNPGSPCATLGHAVAEADAGDTIDLAAGTYTQAGLVIDKAVHLQGQGVVVQ